MSRKRSSMAVIKTARLNPINPAEATALNYIDKLEGQGFNFKQIAVDAINFRAGHTPEMFAAESDTEASKFARLVEDLLGEFATELIRKIGTGEVQVTPEQAEEGTISTFTRNFTRGLLQRQQMAQGDDEEN